MGACEAAKVAKYTKTIEDSGKVAREGKDVVDYLVPKFGFSTDRHCKSDQFQIADVAYDICSAGFFINEA